MREIIMKRKRGPGVATLEALSALVSAHSGATFMLESLANAQRLVTSARLLTKEGLFGPARSLAITAKEEIGKSLIAMRYLHGEISSQQFVSDVLNHPQKQAWGLAFAEIGRFFANHSAKIESLVVTGATIEEAIANSA